MPAGSATLAAARRGELMTRTSPTSSLIGRRDLDVVLDFRRAGPRRAMYSLRLTGPRVSPFSNFAYHILKKTKYSRSREGSLQADWESARAEFTKSQGKMAWLVRPSTKSKKAKGNQKRNKERERSNASETN
jgi:hypothetical protein